MLPLIYTIVLLAFSSIECMDYIVEATAVDPFPTPNTLNITTLLHKKASLPCHLPPSRKFIWMHSNPDKIISIAHNIITNEPRLRIDFLTSDLIINKVQLKDEGLYICQTDTMSSARVYLNVLVPPYLNKELNEALSTSLTAIEGSDMQIYCNADGKPRPTISWYLTRNINSENNLLTKNPVLKLRNLTRHSHKRYECVATNGLHPSLSRTFTINILFKPTVKQLEIKNNCEHAVGALVVGCHVAGSPTPLIKWYVNGTKLDENNPFLSKHFRFNLSEIKGIYSNIYSKLELQEYTVNDLNLRFECRADNHVGSGGVNVDICSNSRWPSYVRHSKSSMSKNDTLFYSMSGGCHNEMVTRLVYLYFLLLVIVL